MASAAVLATALIAAAQTTPSVTATVSPASSQKMILEVGPAGKVLLRGTIASVSSGNLTVTGWGGVWTINVGSSAEILPASVANDLTQFKAGDFVGIQGTINQSANWTIDATVVRDWTYRAAVNQERKQNIQSVREIIKSGTPRNYVGTASNISTSSFTLTVNGTTDTVNVATGAKVVNRNWVTIPLASIQNNDNVRVWGVNASSTITAQIVRDISIPAK